MQSNRKNSKKRQAILELLRSTQEHPSAEWIYAQLKPTYPDLSLATVYRNLALFKEEGQIISVGTVNGQERYDGLTEQPHAHFICSHCGRILDLMLPEAEVDRFRLLTDEADCCLESYRLSLTGTCSRCRWETV